MIVLIWATLLFSVRGSNADTGASTWGQEHCPNDQNDYCVTLSKQNLIAETGLCVVIPCSFKTASSFTTQHIVWFKCEASKERCDDADPIFHSNKNNNIKVQSGFEGRVSLLEPDVSQRNCSIIINDLKESDSGSYQLRVTGNSTAKNEDGFTFPSSTTVSVKGLNQTLTVMIPTLTEGQQATLTCTAPGLCSGSVPEITWTWRGAGGTESHITGNITALKTENLSAVTQRYISTLTFNPSAEHHNTSINCKISFTGGTTTEETSTLKVNYVRKVRISENKSVKEGETLNLTCSVESFPPSRIMWTKLGSNTNLHNDTGSATLVILNVTAEHSGQYVCTVEYMNNTLKENINITVIYKRKPQIIGNTTVKEGDVLNLTCSVESFPPALIVWKKLSFNASLQKGIYNDLHTDTGSASLVIHNVTAEHSGEYICTAKHLGIPVTSYVNVTVTWFSKIQNGSGCVLQSEVLTCVCISEGFPLPTIKWPLLKDHTEYSVITTVSNHTVNSTVRLPVKKHDNATVECVSNNGNGKAKEKLLIQKPSKKDEQSTFLWPENLEVIIAFLTGVVLSSVICCLAKKVHRKKQKSSRNWDEMVTHQDDLMVCDGQALQGDQTLHSNTFLKEVVYANIDLSLLKRNGAREAATKQENTKTEYAEIKNAVKEEKRDDGEMLEGKEEEVMMEVEMKHCEPEKEELKEEAVYSTVKDLIDEI